MREEATAVLQLVEQHRCQRSHLVSEAFRVATLGAVHTVVFGVVGDQAAGCCHLATFAQVAKFCHCAECGTQFAWDFDCVSWGVGEGDFVHGELSESEKKGTALTVPFV